MMNMIMITNTHKHLLLLVITVSSLLGVRTNEASDCLVNADGTTACGTQPQQQQQPQPQPFQRGKFCQDWYNDCHDRKQYRRVLSTI